MQKILLVLVLMVMAFSFSSAGCYIGEKNGWDVRWPSVVGTLVGSVCGIAMFCFGTSSKRFKSQPVTMSDDLNPGLYECLSTAFYNGSFYHTVIPITDHKSEWTADHPILVQRHGDDIPRGQFNVSSARKVIRPCEKATV